MTEQPPTKASGRLRATAQVFIPGGGTPPRSPKNKKLSYQEVVILQREESDSTKRGHSMNDNETISRRQPEKDPASIRESSVYTLVPLVPARPSRRRSYLSRNSSAIPAISSSTIPEYVDDKGTMIPTTSTNRSVGTAASTVLEEKRRRLWKQLEREQSHAKQRAKKAQASTTIEPPRIPTMPPFLVAEKKALDENSYRSICTFSHEKSSKQDFSTTVDLLFTSLHEHDLETFQRILISRNCKILYQMQQGNTPLHWICQYNLVSFFQIILRSTNKKTLLKLLCTQNHSQQQTPLHIACQYNRNEIVQTIVYLLGNTSTVSQLFFEPMDTQKNQPITPFLTAIQAGAIDVVESLLLLLVDSDPQKLILSGVCPLCWAIQHGRVAMVKMLLLYYMEEQDKKSILLPAMHVALESQHDYRKDILHDLILAGGNPCWNDNDDLGGDPSVIVRAIKMYKNSNVDSDDDALDWILSTYQTTLKAKQRRRREDPVLRKQPESYFYGKESVENFQLLSTLAYGVSLAMILDWEDSFQNSSKEPKFERSWILLRHGAKISTSSLFFICDAIGGRIVNTDPNNSTLYSRAVFAECCSQILKYGDLFRFLSSHDYTADCHFKLTTEPHCEAEFSWVPDNVFVRDITGKLSHGERPDVILLTEGNVRFECHSTVLTSSDKLEAALHFEKSRHSDSSCHPIILHVGSMSSFQCQALLCHLYFGTISYCLSESRDESTVELIELLSLAEEFLCSSFALECTLRLCSLSFRPYFEKARSYPSSYTENVSMRQNLVVVSQNVKVESKTLLHQYISLDRMRDFCVLRTTYVKDHLRGSSLSAWDVLVCKTCLRLLTDIYSVSLCPEVLIDYPSGYSCFLSLAPALLEDLSRILKKIRIETAASSTAICNERLPKS